jgi:hypothetical protein
MSVKLTGFCIAYNTYDVDARLAPKMTIVGHHETLHRHSLLMSNISLTNDVQSKPRAWPCCVAVFSICSAILALRVHHVVTP